MVSGISVLQCGESRLRAAVGESQFSRRSMPRTVAGKSEFVPSRVPVCVRGWGRSSWAGLEPEAVMGSRYASADDTLCSWTT